jgi:hypothetical protein
MPVISLGENGAELGNYHIFRHNWATLYIHNMREEIDCLAGSFEGIEQV